MLDPGNAQHMATYPALSFPKHNTPSPQRWKGLHLRHKWKPRAHNATHKGDPTKQKGTTTLSTSPIPLPQTTAITCLSEPAPTNQLATLSQDQQAKRARHTQDALPGTRKRTRSQTESQQHTPLTRFPLCNPKRHGYNQRHLTCRASSYSSCSHTRLLTYSHRQPYITAPNKKRSSHTRISIATTSKEMFFNPLLKQSVDHHRPSTSSK